MQSQTLSQWLLTVMVVATSLMLSSISHAGAPTVLSEHGKWTAYTSDDNGAKTCFMVSKPTRSQGNYKSRDPVYAFITHWPKDGDTDVVSIVAGYTYQTKSTVELSIGNKNFRLLTKDDRAWARDTQTDRTIVREMIAGNSMVVKGKSQRGTLTTDTFSLQGFTAAYRAISSACSVKNN